MVEKEKVEEGEKIDLNKMVKTEVKEQLLNPNKFDALSKDPTSKYYVVPNMVKKWKDGKELTSFPLNELSIEVIIFLLRLLINIDKKRTEKEILKVKDFFGTEFFQKITSAVYP